MTDKEIHFRKALENDKEAFGRLIDLYKDRLINLAYKLTGNRQTAEDITQDAFIKAYIKLSSFKERSSFVTWLYRITYNTSCNYLRANKVKTLFLREDLIDPKKISVVNNELKYEVNKALNKLPIKLKTVIILKDYEGLSYKKISEIIKRPIGTVESRLNRARKKLKGFLKEYIEGD